MTDITKCTGEGCERRDTCYRYTAPADPERQSFAHLDPKNCEDFIPNERAKPEGKE